MCKLFSILKEFNAHRFKCIFYGNGTVGWLSQSQLFSDLQAAKAAGRFEKKFAELTKITLLIIDDFGLRPLRTPQDEDFHDLISERYERTTTIVTSNLDFDEWVNAFPNRLLAAATLDRLRHNAHRVTLDGASYRKGRKDTPKKG
jgi:DNA replication protein DnaC